VKFPSFCAMLLIGFLPLGACTKQIEVKTEFAVPVIDPRLFECPDQPDKPQGDFTQADVAEFIVELSLAHKDCKTKLGSVRELLNEFDSSQSHN